MKNYIIDGSEFSTLEEFAEHFNSHVLMGSYRWRGNLDAFNDILHGGFGTPEEGFRLIWEHSDLSRERLGHLETSRQLEFRQRHCHPSNRGAVAEQLQDAKDSKGPTVFEWIVEIIHDLGPGGQQSEDGIVLETSMKARSGQIFDSLQLGPSLFVTEPVSGDLTKTLWVSCINNPPVAFDHRGHTLDLSLRYEDNSTAHDDLILRFDGQTRVCDSYYFALDRNIQPHDESPAKVKAVLRDLLKQWHTAASNLPDGGETFLPYDFSDEYTGWIHCQRDGNEMIVSVGWALVQGHSIFPSAVGEYFSGLPGFNEEGPAIRSSREDLLRAISDSLAEVA
jgi:RNAse (barnase) inhibitor barstar